MAWLKILKQVSSRLHSPTGAFGERLRNWQRCEQDLARGGEPGEVEECRTSISIR